MSRPGVWKRFWQSLSSARPAPRRPALSRRRPPGLRLSLGCLEERAVPTAGALDTAFSGDGKQTVGFDLGGSFADKAWAVAVAARGRIVVAGQAQVGTNDGEFAAAPLPSSGARDTTFSGDGKHTVSFDLGGGL